jgi:hypothetical protein
MELIRQNRFGLTFRLTEQPDKAVKIELLGNDGKPEKAITVSLGIDYLNQAWYKWSVQGEFVQKAFSHLNADEREFLITGLTGAEFDAMADELSDDGEDDNV